MTPTRGRPPASYGAPSAGPTRSLRAGVAQFADVAYNRRSRKHAWWPPVLKPTITRPGAVGLPLSPRSCARGFDRPAGYGPAPVPDSEQFRPGPRERPSPGRCQPTSSTCLDRHGHRFFRRDPKPDGKTPQPAALLSLVLQGTVKLDHQRLQPLGGSSPLGSCLRRELVRGPSRICWMALSTWSAAADFCCWRGGEWIPPASSRSRPSAHRPPRALAGAPAQSPMIVAFRPRPVPPVMITLIEAGGVNRPLRQLAHFDRHDRPKALSPPHQPGRPRWRRSGRVGSSAPRIVSVDQPRGISPIFCARRLTQPRAQRRRDGPRPSPCMSRHRVAGLPRLPFATGMRLVRESQPAVVASSSIVADVSATGR